MSRMMSRKIADSFTSTVTLNDGVAMPLFGLGVYLASVGGEAEKATATAIKHGYRLIDTAAFYKNEEDVGKAVNTCGVKRDELFIVTKCWDGEHGKDNLKPGFQSSLKKLNTGHVDLYLIHNPMAGKNVETYQAMLDLKKEGLVRSVGVSNFNIHHLEGLKKAGLPTPSVNQIELNPWLRNKELVDYCIKEGITVMGYSPMAKAQKFNDPEIKKLAEKYNKTTAQMMIRWSVQNGFITIPKSVSEERIIGNSQVFDWTIADSDFNDMNSFPEVSCTGAWQPLKSPWTG